MNAEWIMVIITGIYVVATIFICWANIKSANASKEQLKEMQKQYAETNRPLIELEFHYTRRTWYIVRFVNHGNRTAQHVRINLDQSFIDSLPEESFRNELEWSKGRECIIGVDQYYELFIGSNKLRSNPNMTPDLFVDLEHYMIFLSATTDEEDLLKSVNKISDQLKGIRQALNMQKGEIRNSAPDDNNT